MLAWLLPAPAAAGEPQDGAARALLAPLLELALAHTHARTPLPEGTVGLLFAACDGDGAAGVPAPLLPALCVASNKWAKDEELAALIDRDQAILDAALDGGGGAAEALSKLHRWVWLSKVRAWRASAVKRGTAAGVPLLLACRRPSVGGRPSSRGSRRRSSD